MRKIVSLLLVFFVVIGFTPAAALGGEAPAVNSLSLEEAEKQVISYSLSLKETDLSIERAYEVRKSAANDVISIAGVPLTPVGGQDSLISGTYAALLSADLNWRSQEKMLAARLDALRASAFRSYTDVLAARQNLLVAEANYRSAQWKLNASIASFQCGLKSQSALDIDRGTYEACKATYKAAQENEAKAYQALNRLMGCEPDTRWTLNDDPEYASLQVDNLDYHISKVVNDSPSVWSAEQKSKLAQSILDLYPGSAGGEPYAAKALDVDQAKLAHQNTKESIRNQVESLYLQLRQTEEQYQAALENIKCLEEALRLKQIGYEVGINVWGDLLAAEAELTAARAQAATLKYAHENQKLLFEKPWIAALSS